MLLEKEKKIPADFFFLFGIVIVVSADDTGEILDFVSVINIRIKKSIKKKQKLHSIYVRHLQYNFIYAPVFTPSVWTSRSNHLWMLLGDNKGDKTEPATLLLMAAGLARQKKL